MLSNMAGRSFSPLQPLIGLLLLSPAAYHMVGCSAATEVWLTNGLTLFALALWCLRMVILARQWCDFANTSFFLVPKEKRL